MNELLNVFVVGYFASCFLIISCVFDIAQHTSVSGLGSGLSRMLLRQAGDDTMTRGAAQKLTRGAQV